MFTDLMMPMSTGWIDDVMNELMKSNRVDFSEVFPPMNVFYQADDKAVEIEMALAGYKREEIKIEVDGNRLVVKGEPIKTEEKTGKYFKKKINKLSFTRAYELPDAYDLEKIDASYEDGILSIHVPAKKKVEPKIKKISIR